ncbi:MAG: hypothetical protein ACYCSW_10495 [bacterium]
MGERIKSLKVIPGVHWKVPKIETHAVSVHETISREQSGCYPKYKILSQD